MKKIACLFLFTVLSFYSQSCKTKNIASEPEDLTRYVDPLIGTAHCRWFHVAPGANPFGMAKPGPSTNGHLGNPGGWEAVGYDFRDTSIEGFPNFHEFQIGGVVFMPTNGELKTIPGEVGSNGTGYRSSFDRKDELMNPGYYSVMLKDYGIKAELTSTSRVSFHRYTFPANKQSHIIFDIGNKQGESGKSKMPPFHLPLMAALKVLWRLILNMLKNIRQGQVLKCFSQQLLIRNLSHSVYFMVQQLNPEKMNHQVPEQGFILIS